MSPRVALRLQGISANSGNMQLLTALPSLPILAPCHDSFVIGFDGSAVLRCALFSNFAGALACSKQS
ncbi:hypothetical protein EMIT0P395_90209 [Pseudomonas sp. IT-P395]